MLLAVTKCTATVTTTTTHLEVNRGILRVQIAAASINKKQNIGLAKINSLRRFFTAIDDAVSLYTPATQRSVTLRAHALENLHMKLQFNYALYLQNKKNVHTAVQCTIHVHPKRSRAPRPRTVNPSWVHV